MIKLTFIVFGLVSMSLSAAEDKTTVLAKAIVPAQTSAKSAEVVPMQLHDLPEVGRGRFQYLFWHVYDARLQSVDGEFVNYQQSAPLLLSLTYQRDISKAEFIDATLEQWRYQHGDKQARHQQWAMLLADIWQDVKTGDTLSCQRLATGEVQFFLNQRYLGSVRETTFADEFLDIWLGSKTSEPALRKQLLSATSSPKQ